MSSDENPVSPIENVSKAVQIPANKNQSSRKNQGKVAKRIHKAEREKMKREHLNDLFLSLANVLEVSEETNGKASVLIEASKLVKDLLAQIDSLRRENAALLSESQYVAVEKEELQDENSSLESQISELHNQLKARVCDSELDLNAAPSSFPHHPSAPHYVDNHFSFPAQEWAIQQPQNAKSVYVCPIFSDTRLSQQPGNAEFASGPVTTVGKPQARYPTPGDIWPSQLLERHTKLG